MQIYAILNLRILLKIREKVFLGKRFGFKDYDQDSKTNLFQPEENDAERIFRINILII